MACRNGYGSRRELEEIASVQWGRIAGRVPGVLTRNRDAS
jgi:hypothetical protein